MRKDRYNISELAALFDISPRTIRYYEELGLMTSEVRESPYQQRSYPDSERRRLKLILRGKRLGFSLNEIRDMVNLYESNPSGTDERQKIMAYVALKLEDLDQKIEELQALKNEILVYKAQFEAGGSEEGEPSSLPQPKPQSESQPHAKPQPNL